MEVAGLDNSAPGWHGGRVTSPKIDQLHELLRSFGSCLVAYSGGVDSALLACVASRVLGERALAAIADSPSLPRRELAEAIALGERFGFRVRIIQTQEFENPEYLANPTNRCYFCKHELFARLEPLAKHEGFKVIAYGENASDVGDHRPGSKAAAEFQIRAPLKEIGFTKAEIRQFSSELGLPTADKPEMPCLSSRIPHGQPVSTDKLRMIEQSEAFLRDLGFHTVRVRHHDLKGGHLARIELGQEEMKLIKDVRIANRATTALIGFGYQQVTVDPNGYRRGGAKSGTKGTGTSNSEN